MKPPLSEADALLFELERRRRGAVLADPVEFSRRIGIEPDAWQERILRATKNTLVCCTRQAGKSTVGSILVSQRSLSRPKRLSLLISPSLRQSVELFRKVRDVLREAGATQTTDNATSAELENGSRIISLPASEDTIRGYSAVDTLVEDEAAFVPDSLNRAVRPMLAVSRGQAFLLSSPNGKIGHFYDYWASGGDDWERVRVTCWDIPRIDRAFLEAERRAMGEAFRQEYEAEFIDAAGGRVYQYSEDRNACDELPEGLPWTFILSLDFGITSTNAIAVLAFRPHDPVTYVVAAYYFRGGPTEMAGEVKGLMAKYRPERVIGDVGGLGKAFAEEFQWRHGIPVEAADKENKVGFIKLLNGALGRGEIQALPGCADLLMEWRTLPWADNGLKEASGWANHCADAVLYGWRWCRSYGAKLSTDVALPGTAEWEAAEKEKRRREHVAATAKQGLGWAQKRFR